VESRPKRKSVMNTKGGLFVGGARKGSTKGKNDGGVNMI
jgi:hypothetical protein